MARLLRLVPLGLAPCAVFGSSNEAQLDLHQVALGSLLGRDVEWITDEHQEREPRQERMTVNKMHKMVLDRGDPEVNHWDLACERKGMATRSMAAVAGIQFEKPGLQDDAEGILIFVQHMTGKKTPIRPSLSHTIWLVKMMIKEREGVPLEQQRLLVESVTDCDDDKTLADYNVKEGSTIFLGLRLRGGGEPSWAMVPSSVFSPMFDFTFPVTEVLPEGLRRGGFLYRRPHNGEKRLALNVKGKFDDGNNVWLGQSGNSAGSSSSSSWEEWPVSYHGTRKSAADSIIETGFDQNLSVRQLHGRGIYSTPSLEIATRYAERAQYGDDWYRVVLQNRVNPKELRIVPLVLLIDGVRTPADYFIVPDESHIRAYGIVLIKD